MNITQRQHHCFILLILVFLTTSSFAGADEEGTCTVGPDGTCVTDDTSDVPLSLPEETADGGGVSLSLPEESADGYMDTGFGEKQLITGPQADETRQRLREIWTYMHERVLNTDDRILKSVAQECILRNELCAFWAAIGECEANPGYMKLHCAPACSSCEQLSFESRCPMPDSFPEQNIWRPGDLNKMFETLTTDLYYKENYDIEVVLRPGTNIDNDHENDSPWVVTVDNFLTEEECETLIRLGGEQGYEQSKDVGAKKFDGSYDANLSPGRTSTNAWCVDSCFDHEITKRVLHKIANITGIPDAHSEFLQLLRYEERQFYEIHHDYIDFHTERAQGVRILTVFLYLNDVEEGGGTNFPLLDVTVEPKRGRALIWPSVKDKDPDFKDIRTDHQALPVLKGIKYAANAWLHQRDFKTPFAANCI